MPQEQDETFEGLRKLTMSDAEQAARQAASRWGAPNSGATATPLTDAEVNANTQFAIGNTVSADFAREKLEIPLNKLERDLAQRTQERDEARSMHECSAKAARENWQEVERLRSTLAACEKERKPLTWGEREQLSAASHNLKSANAHIAKLTAERASALASLAQAREALTNEHSHARLRAAYDESDLAQYLAALSAQEGAQKP